YTNPTPTPVLSNFNVSGYLYVNNTVTEDGETIPCINVIDVPACQADSSGNEPFVKQVANSLQQDYPEDWAKPDVQELYAQLNKTLSESKPLPEYNAQAQVCSAYDDTSIPIGSDGHFDNTVLTGASDSNVKLEVALGEDNYAEVETLPSSGNINSFDATSAAVLKSCPEKIFAFPGEIVIFKVYSEPGINLKSAGLKFTLNNSSIGCIVQPLYLCLFGAHKYQVAYGCVYIKPGLDTPVDTTINAKLNSGQSMSIFLEVIKKTASVSGTVYTGGSPLVKGYVKSLGPKACCKIDASGQYSLPKVFRGHSRSVIATWWTSENGHKVRHREEKIIDFFNAGVTGFNFGLPPTPTPTLTPTAIPSLPPPSDPYYDQIVNKVIEQKWKWEEELGVEQGVQKTVDWINGKLAVPPLPEEIIPGTVKAKINKYDSKKMKIYFYKRAIFSLDGLQQSLLFDVEPTPIQKTKPYSNTFITRPIRKDAETAKNTRMKILCPYMWENFIFGEERSKYTVYNLVDEKSLIPENGYDVKRLAIRDLNCHAIRETDNPDAEIELRTVTDPMSPSGDLAPYLLCYNLKDDIIRPKDFEDLQDYGIIYIATHGDKEGIYACPYYEDDQTLEDWVNSHNLLEHLSYWEWLWNTEEEVSPFWSFSMVEFKPLRNDLKTEGLLPERFTIKTIKLEKLFFMNQDLSNSILYMNACKSDKFYQGLFALGYPRIFLGYDINAGGQWSEHLAYYYFYFMIDQYISPNWAIYQDGDGTDVTPDPKPDPYPMSAKAAYDTLKTVKATPDLFSYPEGYKCEGCNLILTSHDCDPNDFYFPVPLQDIHLTKVKH
ncbi:MAG: hypothetical protein ABRQ39_27435, partial [Candidatus Eremiobacterota bacterium]